MSIEMDNPKTAREKIDAAANLVEQMNMAKMINDNGHFTKSHKRAGDLLFKALRQLENDGEGEKEETTES
jgi:hypothetical protein